jgi:hypothetical protein
MNSADDPDPPHVQYDPGRGWFCSCTKVWIERVDFSLDCHHWPLCEHLVDAARRQRDGIEPLR